LGKERQLRASNIDFQRKAARGETKSDKNKQRGGYQNCSGKAREPKNKQKDWRKECSKNQKKQGKIRDKHQYDSTTTYWS